MISRRGSSCEQRAEQRRFTRTFFTAAIRRRKLAKTLATACVRCLGDALFVDRKGREKPGAFRGYVCRCFDKLMGIDNAHAIGCVSPKPAGGAGSGPEILNDSPPTAGTRAFSRTPASRRTHCCTYLALR